MGQPVQRGDHKKFTLTVLEQPECPELREHMVRGRLGLVRTVCRRVLGCQIAPSLEGSPGAATCRDELVIDFDEAIASSVRVTFAAEPGHQLTHTDVTADHPINRAACEHFRSAARAVPCV